MNLPLRILILAAAFHSDSFANAATPTDVPPAIRELRGTWIATVENINWPSKPGLSVETQKSELIALLTAAKALRLNAVLLQVRPAGDAMYASTFEPWSYYLTGTQGQAPSPAYDPLTFAVDEAHKRGLQLHAWLNPYRIASDRAKLSSGSIALRRPDLVRNLDKHAWLDPGEKEAQDHTFNVILDVVKRYDVDGVAFDDYFYPYKSYMKQTNGAFPDEASWAKYQATGGRLSRDDWRRFNVDTLVQRVYAGIKSVRPSVLFGIGPFGIWRPGNPPGIVGMDSYNELYCDSKKWFNEGWVDYMTPQLYWALNKPKQSYPDLLNWWAQQNTKKHHLWPSISLSGVGKEFDAADITQRLDITRKQPGASGIVWWNYKALLANQGGVAQVVKQAYPVPALVPASPWLDNTPPAAPQAQLSRDAQGNVLVAWKPAQAAESILYGIYAQVGGAWRMDTAPAQSGSYTINLKTDPSPTAVAVSAVDRAGNESARTVINVSP